MDQKSAVWICTVNYYIKVSKSVQPRVARRLALGGGGEAATRVAPAVTHGSFQSLVSTGKQEPSDPSKTTSSLVCSRVRRDSPARTAAWRASRTSRGRSPVGNWLPAVQPAIQFGIVDEAAFDQLTAPLVRPQIKRSLPPRAPHPDAIAVRLA